MTRTHKLVNLAAVVLPFAALVAGCVLLWNRVVNWTDLALLVVLYLVTALGITVGFHRLFTHRAFEARPALRVTLAVLGSMAVEGPIVTWVADHRRHHAHSDRAGDPHSPHVDHGDGLAGALRGLYHAHMGWLFRLEGQSERRRYAKDLLRDRAIVLVDRLFPALVVLGLALPFALGVLLSGSLVGGLTALLWAGLVRVFLVHHVTWSINSVCHFLGRRRFATDDESRNVFWLALPSLGEAWHHNHHAFPTSASHGLRWWEIDVSALVIRLLERLGLVTNVVRISAERQQAMQAKRRSKAASSAA